jgi:N-formylglutamate amidohydrolase
MTLKMSETSELELFVTRALLITESESSYAEKRAQMEEVFQAYKARIRAELMDEGLEALNEESFRKLRLVKGQ